jgi:hypothetical protein
VGADVAAVVAEVVYTDLAILVEMTAGQLRCP